MRKQRFPQTKDERYLLEVGKLALKNSGDVMAWVNVQTVAISLGYGLKSASNMVNILARTFLVEKGHDSVRLTANTFRLYGEELKECLRL